MGDALGKFPAAILLMVIVNMYGVASSYIPPDHVDPTSGLGMECSGDQSCPDDATCEPGDNGGFRCADAGLCLTDPCPDAYRCEDEGANNAFLCHHKDECSPNVNTHTCGNQECVDSEWGFTCKQNPYPFNCTYDDTCPTGYECIDYMWRGEEIFVDCVVPEINIRLVSIDNLVDGEDDDREGTIRGRVEVYMPRTPGSDDRVWGTVCDDGWDDRDANVVCKQLGYHSGKRLELNETETRSRSHDEEVIHMDDIECIGSETSLLDCHYETLPFEGHCRHFEDAGVICCEEGDDECLDADSCTQFGEECEACTPDSCTECMGGFHINGSDSAGFGYNDLNGRCVLSVRIVSNDPNDLHPSSGIIEVFDAVGSRAWKGVCDDGLNDGLNS